MPTKMKRLRGFYMHLSSESLKMCMQAPECSVTFRKLLYTLFSFSTRR